MSEKSGKILKIRNLRKKGILFSTALCICLSSFPAMAGADKLVSFNYIRSIYIPDKEKEIGIINFDEFLRIHIHNYLKGKSPAERDREINRIKGEINSLKYSTQNVNSPRKPPVVLHWTAGNTALGAIRTLFQRRDSMEEGVIGVDYVISEPLYHPDRPYSPPRAYIVKFSKSDVATTWFHVPDKFQSKMPHQHKKYNSSINIEIVGWRFLPRDKGVRNNMGPNGQLGIRETFNGDFENMDTRYSTYPQVLKLLNHLAEEHGFAHLLDEYSRDQEINRELLSKKKVLYLDGPLSKYIKGHGLIALEHTMMFGSRYNELRSDFTPEELLVLYDDLKGYRNYHNHTMIARDIERRLNNGSPLTAYEVVQIKDQIKNIRNPEKREYLMYELYFATETINTLAQLESYRKYLLPMPKKNRETLTAKLIAKFLNEAPSMGKDDYEYLNSYISSLDNFSEKSRLHKQLSDKFAYQLNESS